MTLPTKRAVGTRFGSVTGFVRVPCRTALFAHSLIVAMEQRIQVLWYVGHRTVTPRSPRFAT